MKLNIGCGLAKREGYVNIDRMERCDPDLLWDLERTPYPFDDNSVNEIVAHHVLAHVGRQTPVFLAVMQELHRILAPGGIIDIITWHPRCDEYWYDPTHVRPITARGMGQFSRAYSKTFAEAGLHVAPLAEDLGVDFEIILIENRLFGDWGERFTAGELSADEVDRAAAMNWNVVEQVNMVMRKL